MEITATIETRNYVELSGIMVALSKLKKKWEIKCIHDITKTIRFSCDYSDIHTVLRLPFKKYTARRSGYFCKDEFICCCIKDENNNTTYVEHSDGYFEECDYSSESKHKLVKRLTHYPDGSEESEVFYPYK